MIKQRQEAFSLSPQTVDAVSDLCAQALAEAEVDRKDALRVRLSLEEILGVWMEDMAGAKVQVKTGHRLGHQHIEITVEGPHIPTRDDDPAFFLSSRLLAQSGLVPVYSYKDGRNILRLDPPKKRRLGFMARIGIAVVLALVLSQLCGLLPPESQETVLAVTGPLFDLFAGLLRAVATPLIFLSVCWGILGMGDLSAFGRMGRVVISRLVLGNFIVGTLIVLGTLWLFPVTLQGQASSTGGFADIYRMLLDIVPANILSPFLEGNALQVIFLGVCCGVALLAMSGRASGIQDLIGQLNELVMYFMSGIGKLLPVFIFLSIFNLLLSGLASNIGSILKMALITAVGCVVLITLYLVWVSVKLHVRLGTLVKKLLPPFLLALSTASSSAALSLCMDGLETRMGAPRSATGFAVPLGLIIYMPGSVIAFTSAALCMAESYGVAITPSWLICAVITVAMMALASPPVPGGGAGLYAILFAQLGIPVEGVALAVALDSILDFLMTATSVTCLQADVLLALGKLDMLDMEVLRSSDT